jgi:hypothetical protein
VSGPSSGARPPSRKPRESPLCTGAELAEVRDRLITVTARAEAADTACAQAQRGNTEPRERDEQLREQRSVAHGRAEAARLREGLVHPGAFAVSAGQAVVEVNPIVGHTESV